MKYLIKQKLEDLTKNLSESGIIHNSVGDLDLFVFNSNFLDKKQLTALAGIAQYIKKCRGINYKYPFFLGEGPFREFCSDNAVMSIIAKDGLPIGMNFNKVDRIGQKHVLATAGLGITSPHSLKIPLFEILSASLPWYVSNYIINDKDTLWVSNLACDGQSLEYFAKFTQGTTFPLDGCKINYKYKAIYSEALRVAFSSYVVPCFPNATLCENTSIVTSDKSKIGFSDSFHTSNHGSDVRFSSFIKNWITDYSKEDILFVGIIPRETQEYLSSRFKTKGGK